MLEAPIHSLCECAISPNDPSGHTWVDLNAHLLAISLAMSKRWQDLIHLAFSVTDGFLDTMEHSFPLFIFFWLEVTPNCWIFTLSLFANSFPVQPPKHPWAPGTGPASARIWGCGVSTTGPQASWNIPSSRDNSYETVNNYNQLSKEYKCAKCREREEWVSTNESKLKRQLSFFKILFSLNSNI